jgi:hypothetical protein
MNQQNVHSKVKRCDTLHLSKEFNKKYFNEIILKIDNLSIIKDDIANFRSLTNEQLSQIETFTESQKIEIINLYNAMFNTLENVVV